MIKKDSENKLGYISDALSLRVRPRYNSFYLFTPPYIFKIVPFLIINITEFRT